MILFLSVIGILLSVIILYFNARKYTATAYLGFFFLAVSLYSTYYYILFNSKSVAFVSLALTLIPLVGSFIYLTGPLFYWYIRSIITDDAKFKKTDYWHLLPMLLFFTAGLNVFFIPQAEREAAARAIVVAADAIQYFHPTLLSDYFSYSVLFLSRPILILAYLIWAGVLYIRFLMNPENKRRYHGRLTMARWLSALFVTLLILIISHILAIFYFTQGSINYGSAWRVFQLISASGLAVIMILPFFFPEVLYGMIRTPESRTKLETERQGAGNRGNEPQRPDRRFEADYLQLIRQKVDACMLEQRPYLQSDCNIASFSRMVQIPPHHLAYYFREVKKQPFNDFRNEWRIRHAKNLIREGKTSGLTLEAIGFASGFTSRSAFFLAFKRVEGIPPGSFSALHRE